MQRREFLKVSALFGASGVMPGLLGGCSPPPLPGTGELRTTPTVCNICFWQCAATLYTENGRPWKVVGNPADPHCNGRLCTRGTGGIASYSDPDRLKRPLIRVRQGNSQSFKPVSWDEAFDVGSDTLTGVNDADYKPPFPLTAKLNKLTIKVDRPQLSEEEAKKLENTQAIAVDGNPIHHIQGGPH